MICTFYSYKGGVGRSMAMANVADMLARRGLKVLMVDFDLEAPGLEQFFRINHDGVRRNPGLLDLLLDYKHSMSMGGRGEARFRDISRYHVPVYPSLRGGGCLDLLPAGQRHDPEQLARYALNLRTFDWQDFYYNWQGERFFEWLRRSLTPEPYDLVLVDSRTGVTEMGGICGYQLADTIVMLCAANHQNVDGTVSMLRDFRSPPVEALRRDRDLDIVVVPARIEQGDPQLLEDFFARFADAFSDLVPGALAAHGMDFRDLTIPYEPLYAFEEQVVSDPNQSGPRQHIGTAFERLADAVAVLVAPSAYEGAPEAGAVPAPPAPAPAATQYDAAKRFADFDVFLASTARDRAQVPAMKEVLAGHGLRVFTHRPGTGDEWQAVLEDSLFHSKVLVLALGPEGLTEYGADLLALARRTTARGEALPIVPVLLPGATIEALAEAALERFQAVDFRGGTDEAGLERLHQAVRACLAPATHVEAAARRPYSGPEAWSEHDSDLFFGRDALIESVLEGLRHHRIVSVTGPSGSGKTSLIRAGVIPRLRGRDGEGPWTILSCTCRRREVDGIDTVLYHHLGLADDMTLPDLATMIEESARSQPGSLLLVVDQVEDMLDTAEWELYAAMLGAALKSSRQVPGFHAILITRSDALPRLSVVEDLGPLVMVNQVQVGEMSPQQLRAAIEGPLERVGAAFEPGLVGRILKEMEGQPEALPLLQELLHELWLKRRNGWLTNEAYDELGGIGGVVVSHAESVYGKLGEDDRAALRRIMMGLVRTTSSGKDSRRRQPLSALLPVGAEEGDTVGETYRELAERLVDEHLLIARATDSGRRAVELAHEALIRSWPRMRSWLDEDRRFLQWRDRLADAANAWDQAGRPGNMLLRRADLALARDWHEGRASDLSALQVQFITTSSRRRNRAMMISLAVLSAVAVLTSGTAFFAWQQRSNALQQQREAEFARANAELLRKTAVEARNAAEEKGERLQAEVDALQARVEEMNQYTRELEVRQEKLAENEKQRLEWEKAAKEAQKTADRLRESLKTLRTNVTQQAPVQQTRVYVHYGSKAQRALAVRLARALQSEGIEVPALDLTNPVKTSQLRYFSDDKQAMVEARRLVTLLKRQGVSDLVPRQIRPGREPVREGQYELWLSPGVGAEGK